MSIKPDGMFITEQEFLFLSTMQGIREFYGLPMGKSLGEEPEQELYGQVFTMIQNGLMVLTENGLEADPWLVQAFAVIRDCSCMLMAATAEVHTPVTCYYLGEQIVCVRESLRSSGSVYIGMMEKKQLAEDLITEYAPPFGQLDPEGLEDRKTWEEGNFSFLPAGQILQNEKIRFLLDKVQTDTGEITERMLILEGDLYPQLYLTTQEGQKESYCSRESFSRWTEEMAERREEDDSGRCADPVHRTGI